MAKSNTVAANKAREGCSQKFADKFVMHLFILPQNHTQQPCVQLTSLVAS